MFIMRICTGEMTNSYNSVDRDVELPIRCSLMNLALTAIIDWTSINIIRGRTCCCAKFQDNTSIK